MVYQVSHEHCNISQRSWRIIKREVEKIGHHLPGLTGDLPRLSLFIKWHSRRGYYDGFVDLRLPKKLLRVDIFGTAIEHSLIEAFKSLLRELTKYEALHFKGNSRYPKHELNSN
mgnify:CR=1 FL=1